MNSPLRAVFEEGVLPKYLLLIFLFLLILFQNWNKIDSYLQGEARSNAIASADVVMYATSWCGYCQRARDFFEENKIHYTEYDIERDRSARERYAEYRTPGVPLIIVNGKVVRGFDRRAILAALK